MKYFCNTRLEAFKSLEQLVGKNLSFGGIVNNVQHRVAKMVKVGQLFKWMAMMNLLNSEFSTKSI